MIIVNTLETTELAAKRNSLSTAPLAEKVGTGAKGRTKKIAFCGHFGSGNFGNESTLQAMLCCLRRLLPQAEFNCICTDPTIVATAYNINALPSREIGVKPRTLNNRLARLARKFVIGIPSELRRGVRSLK